MQYRWRALFQRTKKTDTPDGAITSYEEEEKQGVIDGATTGQEALFGVIEATKLLGNLGKLEIERTS